MFKRIVLTLVVSASFQPLLVKADLLKDPTRPPDHILHPRGHVTTSPDGNDTPSTEEQLHLTSIIASPESITAIINGQRVSRGDKVGTARVLEVEANSVRVRRDGSTFTIHLFPKIPKTVAEGHKP